MINGRGLQHVPDRVHIAPAFLEIDRLVLPFLEMKGERLHLFTFQRQNKRSKMCLESICSALDRERKSYEIHRTDSEIFHLITAFKRIIKEELGCGNQVFVNLSSGGHLQTVAAFMATCASPGAITPYFAYPKRLNDLTKPAAPQNSCGVEEIITLPHFTINAPDEDSLHFLRILAEVGEADKKTVRNSCQSEGLIRHQGKSRPYGHVMLENKFIRPMEKQGLMAVTENGRRCRVQITEKGRDMLLVNGLMEDSA